jgi:hypothetical protein
MMTTIIGLGPTRIKSLKQSMTTTTIEHNATLSGCNALCFQIVSISANYDLK